MRFCINDLKVPDDEVYPHVQGNILRGFRKLRAAHVFFRFKTRAEAPRAWLQAFFVGKAARLPVTSAQDHDKAAPGTLLANLFVTAAGLAHLGHDVAGMDRAFVLGSRHPETSELLDDLAAEHWQDTYRRPWHGMALLACDDPQSLSSAVEILGSDKDAETHVELGLALDGQGRPLTNPKDSRHEHFGFRDGLSQPVYLEEHWQAVAKTCYGAQPPATIDPRRNLSVVLAKDPLAAKGFGSYVVYRKLSQDVGGFHRRVAEYVEKFEQRGRFLADLWREKNRGAGYEPFRNPQRPTGEEIAQFIKRRMMGRDTNGMPWPAWYPTLGAPPPSVSDFDFSQDRGGRSCPFSAHVRKMNPRGTTGDLEGERRRTLTRRGMPYGPPFEDGAQDDGSRGLLFLCMQASIREQFEFVQRNWANARSVDLHAWPTPGGDSLIAQPPGYRQNAYGQDRHRKISQTIELDLDFYDLITLRGSEYLFAPSLTGLEALAKGGV